VNRPRTRYKSEQQIIAAIDALKAKLEKECKDAEALDAKADQMFALINAVTAPDRLKGKELEVYHWANSHATEDRKRAGLLRSVQARRQKQLERLKNVLAEFRTCPMQFLEDTSVIVAKGWK
jgi:hypothetical protein